RVLYMRKSFLALLFVSLQAIAFAAAPPNAADAAQQKDAAALRALVKQHADVNAAQPDGTTALHWAAHWYDAELVDLLLRAGANAKAANRYGATPLGEAVAAGSAGTIDALLRAGADPRTLTTPDG